jgi:hypothetical protein
MPLTASRLQGLVPLPRDSLNSCKNALKPLQKLTEEHHQRWTGLMYYQK